MEADDPSHAVDIALVARSASSDNVLRALVVDDSVPNRKVVVRSLERLVKVVKMETQRDLELEVHQAEDGSVAVAMMAEALRGEAECEDTRFDVVFMDNIMRSMHGPEAATEMRKLGYAGLICGVTGNVMEKEVAHFKEMGANVVMEKPFTRNTSRG